MAGMKLLHEARAAGLKVRVEGDQLIIRGPKSAERVAKALLERKADILPLLTAEIPPRSFLSRPLGQEDNPDPWDAWAPFMLWLLEYHPRLFEVVCEAEEAIRDLEQQGITAGEAYDQACK